ncbi:Uncharacterised protein [Vibrio cholerae]|nr:Uncharacterised protein [Vibrio cholerae]
MLKFYLVQKLMYYLCVLPTVTCIKVPRLSFPRLAFSVYRLT